MIKKIRSLFNDHPKSAGETYFQHLIYAFWAGSRMVLAGICCMAHAILPFIFMTTGSRKIETLYKEFQKKKRMQDVP